LTQDDAKKALQAAGLVVAQVVPRNSNQPPGQVLEANPASGTQVPIHSGVTLFVSNGHVQVPDVVGQTVQQATQTLATAGFQTVLDPGTSTPDSVVLSQDPAPGSFLSYGSKVTLHTDAPTPTPTQSPTPSPSEPTPTLSPTATPSPT
jgi:beta-lactam-binding protein with PASTA domain